MGFLSGRVSFDRLTVVGNSPRQLTEQHIKLLRKFAIGDSESDSAEAPAVGFIAGKHLFDLKFEHEKNIIAGSLHAAMRIDISRIPGPLKKAWMEIELAALVEESENGRVTRAMKQQAQETVQERCDEELRAGKFRRMTQIPFLWDLENKTVYCGSTSATVQDHLRILFEQAFQLGLQRVSAGSVAERLAETKGWSKALEKLAPAEISSGSPVESLDWLTQRPESFDYLGNEFLLWLWWHLETESERVSLEDGSEVTAMLNRSLVLQCPRGESGKESITAEGPTQLPEAFSAAQAGKLPRKVGLTLVRDGEQYDFTLQAESLSVSGAAIDTTAPPEDRSRGRGALEERIASIRRLSETIDLLFEAFCARRLTRRWTSDLEGLRRWLSGKPSKTK